MPEVLSLSALGLVLSLFLGLLRVLLGPSAGDRMLATQLIGTAGVGCEIMNDRLSVLAQLLRQSRQPEKAAPALY